MVFGNKQEEEKKYDCTKEYDYIEYRAILNHKYLDWFKSNPSEEDIKRKLFTINTALEQKNRFDSFISLSLSITLITLLLDDRFMDLLWLLFWYFAFLIKAIIVFWAICNAVKYWGKNYKRQNKEISMLKLEKQVLEELIAEKSKPHKVKAKVRRK